MNEFENLKTQINKDVHQQYRKFLLELPDLSIPKDKIEGLAEVPTLAQIRTFLNERLKFFPVILKKMKIIETRKFIGMIIQLEVVILVLLP